MFQRALLSIFLVTTPAWAQATAFDHYGGNSDWHYGRSVTSLGDVDGDGVDDFAASAPFADGFQPVAGMIFVTSGRTGDSLWWVRGEKFGDRFGWSLAGIGDVDGDG